MKITLKLGVKVVNKKGEIIYQSLDKSNSLVRAFLDLLYAQFTLVAFASGGLDTGNVVRSPAAANIFNASSALGQADRGIILGTGSNAVALGDYKLQTPVAHGTGANLLEYQAGTVKTAPTISGTAKYFELQRMFVNNSGGQINVTEVGLYVVTTYFYCIDRTLKSFSIPNGTTATVWYAITVTV